MEHFLLVIANCRAEAREFLPTESVDGTMPPLEELARVLRVKNADESMLRLEEVGTRMNGNDCCAAMEPAKISAVDDMLPQPGTPLLF